MPSKQFRMMPAYGGEPVPWPPIVTPCLMSQSLMRQVAADHVKVLDKELATGEDGTARKWSGQQKAYLKRQKALWLMRAEGKDSHYVRHGTHQRPMDATPPGPSDAQVLRLRRAAKERGDYVTNKEHQERFPVSRSARVKAIVKRWKHQYGDKPKPKTYSED